MRNFAEMYVFCRSKLLRRKRPKGNRQSSSSFSHLFPPFRPADDPVPSSGQTNNESHDKDHPASPLDISNNDTRDPHAAILLSSSPTSEFPDFFTDRIIIS